MNTGQELFEDPTRFFKEPVITGDSPQREMKISYQS